MMTKSDVMPFVKAGAFNEVFTHETLGYFDVTAIRQWIAQAAARGLLQAHSSRFDTMTREDGGPHPMGFLASEREVDEARVASLTAEELSEPVIFVLCPPGSNGEGETHLLVDGVHRLTALYRAGAEEFRLWLIPYAVAKAVTSELAIRRAVDIPWGRKEWRDGKLVDRE